MSKVYAIYNPLSGNKKRQKIIDTLTNIYEDVEFVDFIKIGDGLSGFFDSLRDDDKVILCGGDGTLNHFINKIDTDLLRNEVLYFPAGSGNDFWHDIKGNDKGPVYPLNKYVANLPVVEVNGIKRKFINGIGCGLDGYCCAEGDRIRKKSNDKPVNYTYVALKGLLYDFTRGNALVTIDGITKEYKDVWMVPVMNGRYYGGGMKCAPNQNRLNDKNEVCAIIVHSKSRLKLLLAFTTIYFGGHVHFKSIVTEVKGSNIEVEFDTMYEMQVDGETIEDVKEYKVSHIKDFL